jgi:Cu2+-exporting ATPase
MQKTKNDQGNLSSDSQSNQKTETSGNEMTEIKNENKEATKTYTCSMHPEVISDTPGNCPKCGMNLTPAKADENNRPMHHAYHVMKMNDAYSLNTGFLKCTCPMHPHIILNAPGKCPLCGMTLEPIANAAMDVHGKHNKHDGMIAQFRKRFYVVLALTVPIMLLSQMIQHWLNIHISFAGSKYELLALSSVVFFYVGWPFLKELVDEAGKRPQNGISFWFKTGGIT